MSVLISAIPSKEKNTRALCVGDPHFQTENVKDCEELMNKLELLCSAAKPDFIVVLGDLLHEHERLHTQVLNRAYELITRLREYTHVYVLVGNHDAITNQIFQTPDHWMNGMKEWERVTVIDKALLETVGDRTFAFVPYVPPGRFAEALDTCGDWLTASTIFAHQEFQGCKMGAIISEKGDPWNTSLPFVVSGHIHNSQNLPIGVHYTGSSLQVAFGETDLVTVSLTDFEPDKNAPLVTRVNLELPRKKIVYTDAKDLDKLGELANPENTKLSVSGTLDDFKAFKKTEKYKTIVKAGAKVIFKPTRAENRSADSETREHIEKVLGESSGFGEVLKKVVMSQKDPYLSQVYDLILTGVETDPDDYLFLS